MTPRLHALLGIGIGLLCGCTFEIHPAGPSPGTDPSPPGTDPGPGATSGSPGSPEDSRPAFEPAAFLAAGAHHVCALSRAGVVSCWGRNGDGQLGYGHTAAIGDDEPAGAEGGVEVGGPVSSLAAGGRHTCAIMTEGGIRCWGHGDDLALGHGNKHHDTIGDDETPAEAGNGVIYGSTPPSQIVAGEGHSCRRSASGLIKCWGTSNDGALGYPFSPSTGGWLGEVTIGGAAISLAAGSRHTCALLDGGEVRCWGAAQALGLGGVEDVGDDELPSAAAVVALGEPVVQLSAGGSHTCALTAQGAVRCWGGGASGALGYAATASILDAAQAGLVNLGAAAVQIAAGREHTCAVTVEGAVRCWGQGAHGELGYGHRDSIGDDEPPASAGEVALAERAVQVALGDSFTCALLESGRVSCWGLGEDGRLGLGDHRDIGDDELPSSVEPLLPFDQRPTP